MSQLIDRVREMSLLKDIYSREGARLFILYGRRRTGKSRLLMESLKGEDGLYYMAVETALEDNLSILSKRMGEFLGDGTFHRITFGGIEEILDEFSSRAPAGTVLVIDEFPYLFKYRPYILSEIQRVWDLVLSERDIKIVLCGSSISMMENKVLSRSSPLYGRREGQWKLMPLPIGNIKDFLPSYDLEDIFRTYSVCDGIPEYLLKFRKDRGFFWNLDNRVLRKGEYLSDEGRILLLQEFSNISNYTYILEAVSCGIGRQKEISDRTGMDKGMISKYISNLTLAGFLEYQIPFGTKKWNRMGRYIFSDNYMQFYFRFIQPQRTEMELDTLDYNMIKEGFEMSMGRIFEKGVIDMMKRSGKFSQVSPWWYKEDELDVVALDKGGKEVLLGDLKWRNRRYSGDDLGRFLERCEKVPVNRKKINFIVSRNGFRSNILGEMEDKGLLHFLLDDLKAAVSSSSFDPRLHFGPHPPGN